MNRTNFFVNKSEFLKAAMVIIIFGFVIKIFQAGLAFGKYLYVLMN